MTNVREVRRPLLADLERIDIPAANQTISITSEHDLVLLIDVVKSEASYIILVLELLLVLFVVQRMIFRVVDWLSLLLLMNVESVFCGLCDLNIVDSLALALMLNDYRNDEG